MKRTNKSTPTAAMPLRPTSPGTRWTPEEIAIFKAELAAGGTQTDVAGRISSRIGRIVTSDAVANLLRRLRLRETVGDGGPTPLPSKHPLGGKLEEAASLEYQMVKKLVALTKKPVAMEALCNTLDVSPARLRGLVATATQNGFRVHLEGDSIGRPPAQETAKTFDILVKTATTEHVIAIVGDIHIGSKHFLRPQFENFCDIAYERGARHFLQPGDLVDGVYRHSRWEQALHGFEEQSDGLVEILPRRKGATWHVILGNHDETFSDETGLDVGRAYVDKFRAAGRNDFFYYGARGAYMHLRAKGQRRGLFVHLWHPRDKGNAYALTYPLQKKIEGFAVGAKPDLLVAGHWHQMVYFETRGVHALSAGCWQGSGSSFAKSLRGSPAIGSWIIKYSLTKDGTIRDFQPTWIRYYEKESVREVALG